MISHRSILYIGGDLRARLAPGEAARNYRAVSAAHPQNALLEFGTDQIEGDRIDRRQNHLDLSDLNKTPKGTGPTTSGTTAASIGSATPRSWTTALTL